MPNDQQKSGNGYLICRVYALVVIVAWNAIGLHAMTTDRDPTVMMVMVPLIIPAIFMVLNLFSFPFKYSVFGTVKRTAYPDEEPILTKNFSWCRIGLMSATIPFASWKVFPSGLGLYVFGVGRAFIPKNQIVKVSSFLFFGKLEHTCPEVRNNIHMPGAVARALEEIA